MIDITAKVKEDIHYAVTVDDIKAYEATFGPIPDGAFVALRTDWYKRWPDMNALSGLDEEGGENFPGWSMEALKYIYEERNAAANGHKTLDTDTSVLAGEAGDLAYERYVLDKSKLQVEVLCNFDKVAPRRRSCDGILPPHRRCDRTACESLGDYGVIGLIFYYFY